MRKPFLVLLGAAATVLVMALPVTAAPTDTTVVTFVLAGGTLDILAPETAALGSSPVTSPTVSGSLGVVEVTDSRGLADATWAVDVSSTDFVGSLTAADTTIPVANIAYDPGTITEENVTAEGTPVPSLLTTPQETVTGTDGTGVNSASWNPTLTVTIPPAAAVAGTYTATVTHSVA